MNLYVRFMFIVQRKLEICIILLLPTEWWLLATTKMLFFLETDAERNISYKNLLQEYLQKSGCLDLPVYQTERTIQGYVAELSIKIPPKYEQLTYQGKPHANKRGAEQECAKQACVELKIVT